MTGGRFEVEVVQFRLPFADDDEPDTLTFEEFRRWRYTLADPPPTVAGRRYEDVTVEGEWL